MENLVVTSERCKKFDYQNASIESKNFMDMINDDLNFVLDPDFEEYIKNKDNKISFVSNIVSKYKNHKELYTKDIVEDKSNNIKSILEVSEITINFDIIEKEFRIQIDDKGDVILELSFQNFVNQIKDMNEELKNGKDIKPCLYMYIELYYEALMNSLENFK
jgi:predicted RNA-binding protein with PUA domain